MKKNTIKNTVLVVLFIILAPKPLSNFTIIWYPELFGPSKAIKLFKSSGKLIFILSAPFN